MTFNPISHDLPQIDSNYPADMIHLDIESNGLKLLNVFFTAQGGEPHPTVLLLHGIPGMERNFDLAHTFRRAGWHVLIIHYRGNWGSPGEYSFRHVLEDSKRAVEVLREKDTAEKNRIDPDRIVAIGHSLGGWLALMLAAEGYISAAASVAGVNLGMWGELLRDEPDSHPDAEAYFDTLQAPLVGSSGKALVGELMDNAEEWNLLRRIEPLVDKKLLLIAGERDTGVPLPLHHMPLVASLQKAGTNKLIESVMDADHQFSDKRIALAQVILDWLGD